MTVTTTPVALLNGATGVPEDAELLDGITDKQLADWEGAWIPELYEVIKKLHGAGIPRDQWPQNRHWNWRNKTQSFQEFLQYPCVSLVCQGMTQGMMIMDDTGLHHCLLPEQVGTSLVYVEYVEAAPWNRKELGFVPPRYRGVGSILIGVAIECSREWGYEGRIGLHSLPQADAWYADKVGMTDLGLGHGDGDYKKLHYFEMTSEQADTFMKKGG